VLRTGSRAAAIERSSLIGTLELPSAILLSPSEVIERISGVAIPPLDDSGLLPVGLYNCSLAELRDRFGSFQSNDTRPRLMQRLEAFVEELRASRIVRAIIVDGSFVTNKQTPNDIDLLVVLPAGHDFRVDLTPAQYRVVDRRRVRRMYGLDVFVVEEDSADFNALIQFFHRHRLQPHLTKGILRIEL
jgi:predicted nucleotidyltransferase